MRILVGLGNPGRQYEKTRHNIGSRIVGDFAKEEKIALRKSASLEAVWGKKEFQEEIRLLMPQSYMNLSGKVIARCVKRWNFPPEKMLVVVDDLQLPLGQLRVRSGGSDGGQKGLRSIIETLGTERFPRLRVGIASERLTGSWETFVLQSFDRREESLVREVVKKATACCRLWIEEGIEVCMNRFNKKGSLDGTL